MNQPGDDKERVSDESALKLCQRNYTEGLKILFDRYYNSLVIFSHAYTGRLEISEDIVQQIFIKFWENSHASNIHCSVKSFLFTSVRNASINYLNKNKTYQKILQNYLAENDIVNEDEEAIEDLELAKAVEEATNKLPQKCRQIFRLVIFEEMKYQEVAQYLGISINTVKTQLRRAYASLRKSLEHLLLFTLLLFF
ncbi:MAG: RNA polymerase sigma-70 factor [Bacteroidales bacterium]|nr:RNA polymerase sigma-70 factor [Bacteroidales bacterium]MCF8338182.1 RNA polymerase sigma-70 factor [Bacteroidales bacterium]